MDSGSDGRPDKRRSASHAKRASAGRSSRETWLGQMSRSEQVVAAVLAAFVAGGLGLAGLVIAQAHGGSSSPKPAPIAPSRHSTSSETGPAAAPSPPAEPRSCPFEKAPQYKQPVKLEGLLSVRLAICPVNVNNGQPVTAGPLTLSGVVHGTVPSDDILAVVTYPDPTTCGLDDSHGSALYYYQTSIDPSASGGYWQLTTNGSYPGSQTIRRYVYFVLAPRSALGELRRVQEKLPNGTRELAYLTVRGALPGNYKC